MVVPERGESFRSRRAAREAERRRLHHVQRRVLLFYAALVGLLAGVMSVAYRLAAASAESLSERFALWLYAKGPWTLAVIAICGGLLGGAAGLLTERFAPEAGGSGIPHIKAVLLNLRTIKPWPLVPIKFLAGWLSLLAGMSLGREGPTIQMGAAMGKVAALLGRMQRRTHNLMVAAGAGAGLAGAFNAPLAGFLFVMEELRLTISPVTYGVALFASVCSVAVTRTALGQVSSFELRNPNPVPLPALSMVAVLGIIAGFVGLLYNESLIGFLSLRERLKISRGTAGAAVGAAVALLLVYLPNATGGGNEVVARILSGGLSPRVALTYGILLLGAKLLTTGASYGTGVPGGIFAPLLLVGALTGFIVGSVGSHLFPALGVLPQAFATVGMASVFSASVRAPLTGVVLIVEMTGEYNLLYALLLGSFFAYGVPDVLRQTPIYEALLERDLHGNAPRPSPVEPISLETIVEADSFMDGRVIRDLRLPEGTLITTVSREGKVLVAKGSTRLRPGDVLAVFVSGDNTERAAMEILDDAKAP